MNTSTKDSNVTDSKTADSKTADAKTDALKSQLKPSDQAKTDNPGGLAPAGQSGDPTVQKLLAEREIYRMNKEEAEGPRDKATADEAGKKIDEIDKQLEELGYTAK